MLTSKKVRQAAAMLVVTVATLNVTPAWAQYGSAVKAGFDALKGNQGVFELGAAMKMARREGLITDLARMSDAAILEQLEVVRPGITSNESVRYLLTHSPEGVNFQSREVLAYSEDLYPLLNRASFRTAVLGQEGVAATKVTESGVACATGLCDLGELAAAIDDAAGVAVRTGTTTPLALQEVLTAFPGARFANGKVVVSGTLRPLAEYHPAYEYELVSGAKRVLVNAQTPYRLSVSGELEVSLRNGVRWAAPRR